MQDPKSNHLENQIVALPTFCRTDVPFIALHDDIRGYSLATLHKMFQDLLARKDPQLQLDAYDVFFDALSACSLGTIQESKHDCLEASASMGCAACSFIFPVQGHVALVFHGDEHGLKASIYSRNIDTIVFEKEITSKHAPSPNACVIGNYIPNDARNRKKDLKNLVHFVEKVRGKIASRRWIVDWCCVFVTGPLRDYISRNPNDDHTQLKLKEYLTPISTTWNCVQICDVAYVLDEKKERFFNTMAYKTIYDTLTALRLIKPSEVVMESSCYMKSKNCEVLLGFHGKFGSDELASKFDIDCLSRPMMQHAKTVEGKKAMDKFVTNVNEILAKGKRPIIPLESVFQRDLKHVTSVALDAFHSTQTMIDREQHAQKKRIFEDVLDSLNKNEPNKLYF